MKVGGIPITAPPEELLVIPRGEEELVFRAEAISWDHFHKLCKEPEPPVVLVKGEKVPDVKDETFQHQVKQHATRQTAYLVIHSLKPSEIEWTSVDFDDPKTWVNYEKDLLEAGLVQVEVNRLIQLALDANQLDERKLEKAREAFLRGRAAV